VATLVVLLGAKVMGMGIRQRAVQLLVRMKGWRMVAWGREEGRKREIKGRNKF